MSKLSDSFVEQVVPEIATQLAASKANASATAMTSATIRSPRSAEEKSQMSAVGFRTNRPPPLDLNSLSSARPTAASFPAYGVMTGSPRRLREPLMEVVKHAKRRHLSQTLAVSDISRLGSDSLGCLRKYVEKYGKADLIMQPSISWAPGFALVRMDDASVVDSIVAAGDTHVIGKVELSVFRLETFLKDFDAWSCD
eukprot:TRINITY_DN5052_c0_g1_i4.p1 TRINITY_DN5052_c0_g1~~TRINITY_DN5052_c0_g1_i4.p1  ORF type:complete len:197 (+),score=29.19 TRINITY_DN5052_c0_g1_i4:394-984(+)